MLFQLSLHNMCVVFVTLTNSDFRKLFTFETLSFERERERENRGGEKALVIDFALH